MPSIGSTIQQRELLRRLRISGYFFGEDGVVWVGRRYCVHDQVVHVQVSLSDDAAVGFVEDRQVGTLKQRQCRLGSAADGVDGEGEFGGVFHGA